MCYCVTCYICVIVLHVICDIIGCICYLSRSSICFVVECNDVVLCLGRTFLVLHSVYVFSVWVGLCIVWFCIVGMYLVFGYCMLIPPNVFLRCMSEVTSGFSLGWCLFFMRVVYLGLIFISSDKRHHCEKQQIRP